MSLLAEAIFALIVVIAVAVFMGLMIWKDKALRKEED
jgi:hypothetical protein